MDTTERCIVMEFHRVYDWLPQQQSRVGGVDTFGIRRVDALYESQLLYSFLFDAEFAKGSSKKTLACPDRFMIYSSFSLCIFDVEQ